MGRAEFGSLGDVFTSVAKRKREAALARLSGAGLSAENPRDVYLQACAEFASALVTDGFKYLRSKLELSRNVGVFRHRIAFQSDRDNIAGRHVGLLIHADVRCARLDAWRHNRPHPLGGRTDYVAGGIVHGIEGRAAFIEWELADAGRRQATIDDAVSFLRSVVLPYFHSFEDPATVLSAIDQQRPINLFAIQHRIDFAFCFGGRDAAQRVLTRHVASHQELHKSIRRALDHIRRDGLDDYAFNQHNGEREAFAHLAYGLTLGI